MSSPHLAVERDRLLQLIQAVRNSGSVAPTNVWISPAPKGQHVYYKLSSKNPAYKNQHLGKAGSEKHLTGLSPRQGDRRTRATAFYASSIDRLPIRL